MTTDRGITKKGRLLFNLLLAITIAPTTFLLRAELNLFLVFEIASLIGAYLFMVNFPKLAKFKSTYAISQITGLVLGGVVYKYPDAFVHIVLIVLFLILSFIGKLIEIGEVLSSRDS